MGGSLSEQLAAWQQFLTVFAPNNPYSTEDETLRVQATARRDAVEKQLLATLMPEHPPAAAAPPPPTRNGPPKMTFSTSLWRTIPYKNTMVLCTHCQWG